MQFADLKSQIKTISFDEIRADEQDYFEAVFLKDKLGDVSAVLDNAFGGPAWPSAKGLTEDVKSVINDFGGIMPGQTLYFQKQNGSFIFVMLWPWSDKNHTTLKVGQK